MEFSFANMRLRGICESHRKAGAALGMPSALLLKQCLADLAALRNATDLTVLYEGQMVDRNDAERSIKLVKSHHIVICPGHPTPPRSATEGTDRSTVSRIRILEIGLANG